MSHPHLATVFVVVGRAVLALLLLATGARAGAADPSSPEVVRALPGSALDLCRAAEALREEGQADAAVGLADRAYERILASGAEPASAEAGGRQEARLCVARLLESVLAPAAPAPPPAPSADLGLPLADNPQVDREIQLFTGRERELFRDYYRRSGRYRPMILARLEAAGLPSQLSWLPLVESGFRLGQLSPAGALGLWQFIASTGHRYGLRRDAWVDERLDPVKSTEAAIAYLTDLHRAFGDWTKALAAYNCGEACVRRLQEAGRFEDFWDLYAQLPLETRRYVPRLIATLRIVSDPGRYGMELPEPEAPGPEPVRVSVARAVNLEALDAALGLAKGTLRELNPELHGGGTPLQSHELAVPAEKADDVEPAVASLPEWKRPSRSASLHRVASGDTLGRIARRYHVSLEALRAANPGVNPRALRIGQRLRIPSSGT